MTLARASWAALALLSLLGSAWADGGGVYKCRKPDGTVAFSDRPCPEADSTQIARSGPKAPDASQFMSPRCLRLREQLNQAGSDGSTDEATRQQLDYRYQRDCYAEEQEANEKVHQLLEEARNRSLEERQLLAENKARQRLEFSQCVELRNNLRARRARQAEMNAGERADLERLSAAFDQRCRGL
ncbi:uncharacterized protein YaiL (DUF2058 family) [Pelomonas saccharophila]|uniref:Uncharacterized protein YaiL (DUF2058 family) n=1 Tax=Roseateles saccharophilus TaxID=304 RepID=A0ABU1YM38_ROSSA|nr:DUF4124 domain-containing protein [Roseateles saccharophilus]MDR7269924.1 uncharacterized protein YaiL (DUF2058 family) [Roseateles saccharophilus]